MNKIEIKNYHEHKENEYYLCFQYEGQEIWTPAVRPQLERDTLIDLLIRKQYSQSRVESIINNHLLDPTEKHEAEFAAFAQYRTAVKQCLAEVWSEIEAINEMWKPKEQEEPEQTEPITQDGEEVTE